jgi:K+-transporting ATPase ATPase C chain
VTASASGLDPHISPAAAEYQAARVAMARNLAPDRVREVVRLHTEGRQFGILGEPRVNVLTLNLALEAQSGPTKRSDAEGAPACATCPGPQALAPE